MIKYFVILLLLSAMMFDANNELMQKPKNWPEPFYKFEHNELTKEKILLGRVLFYDPILSNDSSISCNNCHSPFSAFTHVDHQLSHGIHDSVGIRNAMALMNLAWQKSFMWDGAISNLDMQSLAPITHKAEMASSIQEVVLKLNRSNFYKTLFKKAYNDSMASGERVLKSISQFMLSLVSANSKYDKVMNNVAKFNEQEQHGYIIFKKNCNTCHTEPLFTNGDFENNGIGIDTLLNDLGRMKITNKNDDALKFKVPTLRNIEFTYPYMHDGRFKKLNQVLNHYASNVKYSATVSSKLNLNMNLTSNEKVDLTAFLLTLSDKEFLFNPKFSYPKEVLFKR
jgi:cytochrome c peroxidase